MRKLIFFCGSADSPFIKNEIVALKRFFDDICVVSYKIQKDSFQKILTDNEIRGYMVPKCKMSFTIIKDLIKWIFSAHVKSEVRNHTMLSVKGMKNFLYILHYGLYVVNSFKSVEKEICNNADDCKIYLYAFWLTRPSYLAAICKNMYKERIMKVVARAHGYDLYEERHSTAYLPFRQFIAAYMDEVHFISKNGKDYFTHTTCKKYNIVKAPLLFLNYLGTFNAHNIIKVIKAKKEVVIASCAYVSAVKRLDLIIDFLAMIGGISVRWIHIGDGKLLDQMKVLSKEKMPNVDAHFYGKIDNSRILSIYNKEDVDFFINLSDSEGLPVSIMEAMSMGIPVIARNIGGIGEIVDCKNGCLLNGIGYDEKIRVRQFIRMRIENVSEYQIFSENAINTWKSKFNAEVNYPQFCEELVNGY